MYKHQRYASTLFLKVRKAQIRNFLGKSRFRYRKFAYFLSVHCAVRKPHIFMINLKIVNLHIPNKCSTTLSQNSPKISFLKGLFCYVQIWIRAFYAIFVSTGMCLRTCGNFKSANHKKYWVRKSVKCDICRRSANLTNNLNRKFADLRYLFADRPTLTYQ